MINIQLHRRLLFNSDSLEIYFSKIPKSAKKKIAFGGALGRFNRCDAQAENSNFGFVGVSLVLHVVELLHNSLDALLNALESGARSSLGGGVGASKIQKLF
jgi:hypothetical protein